LTVFLVPLSLPGIEIHALHTLMDERTNITYYADVKLPDKYRLGPVNGGLKVMAAAMSMEHSGEGYHVLQNSLLDAARTWAQTPHNGKRPVDDAHVRQRLARVAVHTQVADLLCRRSVYASVNGHADRAIGPMSKLFSTESYVEDAADLVALAAPDAVMPPQGTALFEIEEKFRQSIGQTIYGGTSEVHRGIIAENALKLARAS
jgi:alkylation response protein AidB-like acyl-CoA dehydrogenase